MKDATNMMRIAICLGFASFLSASALADQINEIRTEQTGADSDEYVELIGSPSASLDGYFYIVVGDCEDVFPPSQNGCIEAIVDLSGSNYDANGFFVIAEKTFALGTADLVAILNFEGNDNVTHMLVTDFTGSLNDDVDVDNDGVLDTTYWTSIVDSVALIKATPDGTTNDYVYSTETVGPDGAFAPSHVYRCSDTGAWQLGSFELGVDDTPNEANHPCGGGGGDTALINEIRIDQPSTDNDEYFELVGKAGTDLTGLSYVVIGGTGSDPGGKVEAVVPLDGYTIGSSGLFWAAEPTNTLGTPDVALEGNVIDFQNGQNVTHLLVRDCTATDNQDLDTDNDGILDIVPWSEVVDSIALIETFNSGFLTYSDNTVGPDGSYVPGHSYRCSPDGSWTIGEFDAGVTDTPGAENLPCPVFLCGGDDARSCFEVRAEPGCSDASCCEIVAAHDPLCAEVEWDASCVALAQQYCHSTNPAPDLVLSEVRMKQDSTDNDEYVEITGAAGQSLDGVSIVVIGGNGVDLNGEIETAANLSGNTIGSSGYFVVSESTFTLGTADVVMDLDFTDDNNKTVLLVHNFNGTVNGDADTDDDCTLDSAPWSDLIDGVSWIGTGTNCTYYAGASVGPDNVYSPGHGYLCDAGSNTWGVGTFDAYDANSVDTPGAANATDCDITDCPGYVVGQVDYPCTYILAHLRPSCCQTWDQECQDKKDAFCGFEASAPAAVSLREVRSNQPGDDNDEYVELQSDPGTALDGYAILVIGDGTGDTSGVVETFAPLVDATTLENGLAVLADASTYTLGTPEASWPFDIENNDNVTVLLVYGYSGDEAGLDLDLEDDGILDSTPWLDQLDCVAIVNTDPNVSGNHVYCATQIGPDKATGFAPQHIYYDCDLGTWQVGAADPAEGVDSPGVLNNGCESTPACPGDLTGDGNVGGADLTVLLGAWGTADADLDGNGIVDGADLTILLGAWGPC